MKNHIQNMKGKDTQQQFRYQQSQEDPDATVATVATVATDATTNASINSNSLSPRESQPNFEITPRPRSASISNSEKEKKLSTQINALALMSLVSAVLFLLATFSLPSLFFFTVTISTMAMAGQASYQRLLIQINQRGLLYYLPESVQTYIRTTTLHEFMSDSTMFMEYRFLLLYFIPGLSEDQLMGFVNQLPEHRRQLLLNQGQVADIFLPESIRSRLYPISEIEDEIQYEEQMLLADDNNGNAGNPMISSVHDGVPSDLVWESEEMNDVDDTNDNNHNNYHNRNHGNFRDQEVAEPADVDDSMQVSTVETNTATNSSSNAISNAIANAITNAESNTNSTSDWDLDGSALSNAISTAVRSYAREISESVSESLLSSVLSPAALVRSARVTSLLTFSSIAQWSWTWSSMLGHVYPVRILSSLGYDSIARSIANSSRMESESRSAGERSLGDSYRTNLVGRVLLSSTMFMGVSTGMMYYARSSIRRSLQGARERQSLEVRTKEIEKTDKKLESE